MFRFVILTNRFHGGLGVFGCRRILDDSAIRNCHFDLISALFVAVNFKLFLSHWMMMAEKSACGRATRFEDAAMFTSLRVSSSQVFKRRGDSLQY